MDKPASPISFEPAGDVVKAQRLGSRSMRGAFARFMAQPANSGDGSASGRRVMDAVLQKEFRKVAPAPATTEPRDDVKALMETVAQQKHMNQVYLEMQNKFLWMNKSFMTVSNLMKVRHEATKQAITEMR
jgi:hypothetical protein